MCGRHCFVISKAEIKFILNTSSIFSKLFSIVAIGLIPAQFIITSKSQSFNLIDLDKSNSCLEGAKT